MTQIGTTGTRALQIRRTTLLPLSQVTRPIFPQRRRSSMWV
jgi:hypothetical protein